MATAQAAIQVTQTRPSNASDPASPAPVERPIIFSGPMVTAILEGRKAATRRVAWECDIHHKIRKSQSDAPVKWAGAVYPARESGWVSWFPGNGPLNGMPLAEFTKKQYALGFKCPYGKPGDHLWVRETWRAVEQDDMVDGVEFRSDGVFYPIEDSFEMAEKWCEAYDNGKYGDQWRSPIFMPRWASRLTLEITDVRVERLQDITEEDAKAEGIDRINDNGQTRYPYYGKLRELGQISRSPVWAFQSLWDSINGKKAPWESNPWCWCISFRQLEAK